MVEDFICFIIQIILFMIFLLLKMMGYFFLPILLEFQLFPFYILNYIIVGRILFLHILCFICFFYV